MTWKQRLSRLAALALPVATLWAGTAGALEFRERIVNGESILFVSGTFMGNDGPRFLQAVNRMKRIDEVWLKSDGGSLKAGLEIGRHLRRIGLATRVPKGADCASACAYAFLGGVFRSVDPGGRIGVHMTRMELEQGFKNDITSLIRKHGSEATTFIIQLIEQHAARIATEQARYLVEMSVHLDLMHPITNTHTLETHWLRPAELQRFNVVNQ